MAGGQKEPLPPHRSSKKERTQKSQVKAYSLLAVSANVHPRDLSSAGTRSNSPTFTFARQAHLDDIDRKCPVALRSVSSQTTRSYPHTPSLVPPTSSATRTNLPPSTLPVPVILEFIFNFATPDYVARPIIPISQLK